MCIDLHLLRQLNAEGKPSCPRSMSTSSGVVGQECMRRSAPAAAAQGRRKTKLPKKHEHVFRCAFQECVHHLVWQLKADMEQQPKKLNLIGPSQGTTIFILQPWITADVCRST